MNLPTCIKLTCRADGRPIGGIYAQLTLKVSRKNDLTVLGGPTGCDGTALVTRADIDYWANWEARAWQMDYTSLADFTGEFEVSPEGRKQVESRRRGYERLGKYLPFPPDDGEELQEAEEVLDALAPAELTVEVEHDGEGITIRTLTVQA
jgi:hypothetical protein